MLKRISSRKTSVLAGLILLICISAAVIWFLTEEKKPAKDALVLIAADFSDLSGWDKDNLDAFLPALQLSCRKINRLPDSRSLGAGKLAGTAADWKDLCRQALELSSDDHTLKSFIEANFKPFQVTNNDDVDGLFTGYYEASLNGSLTRSEKFATPLYLRPNELIMVNLGRFRENLKGQRIAGQVKNGELVPFHDRTAIEKGALENRELEVVWVDSAVDAFFLHIQGSGRITLDDGSAMRVGYAAQNGHPYFAIGKTLIEEGHVPREKMSMQAIRSWLEENPGRADEVMEKNASYIFFRELKTSGPIGAQWVE
ncbi:MAG: MltA domain-containing protein, partial [Sneathiella sp.]|nr:MltA domain-containing protein [Sneathiella sp.]